MGQRRANHQLGRAWFREIGTETSPGTKVFSIAGNINNSGLPKCPWELRCTR